MRHLSLLLFLLLSSFVSAQCFISVSFLESECVDDGNAFFVNFTVQGGGDTTWTSPTLGISGDYNTGDVFRAGPFANDAFATILFQDLENAACFNVYDTPLPDCPAPGCEGFAITASADPVTFCESGEVWSFNQTGGELPVDVRILNSFGGLARQATIDSPDGFSTFLDEGAYSVVMTDEADCRVSTVIEVSAHYCNTITGFNWWDFDGDGLQNDGTDRGIKVAVSLINEVGVVVDTTSSRQWEGSFTFTGVLSGEYTMLFTPFDEFGNSYIPTIKDAGDDCLDSDVDPVTYTSPAFTLSGQEEEICIDAGWIRLGTIAGRSWRDDDQNGSRSNSETGVVQASVTLFANGTEVAASTTDASGAYGFSGLQPGLAYRVRFEAEDTRVATEKDNGSICRESKIDETTFTTDDIFLFETIGTSCTDAGWLAFPCETFAILINPNDNYPPCWPESEIVISADTEEGLPLYVEFVDTQTLEVILDTIANVNNRTYPDLPSAIFRVTVTSANGCVTSEIIDNLRGDGCGNISGTSWRDVNEDGILNEANNPLSTTVQLLSNGAVIDQLSTSRRGFYGFYDLPVGDYQVQFVAPGGFVPTIRGATGGGDDSDVDVGNGTSDILTILPGGGGDTINAGWVRTLACSEFLLTAGLSPDHQGCSLLGEYVASVAVAAQPVSYYLINSFILDTLETVTLSDPGAEAVFDVSLAGSYRIIARDAAGCSDEYNFNAFDSDGIVVDIQQSGSACTGNGEITLTAVVFSDSTNLSYIWSNGVSGPVLTGAQVGESYSVIVENERTNCSGSWQVTVNDFLPDDLAIVSFDAPFTIGCEQDSVLIQPDTILTGFTYRWFGPSNFLIESPSFYATTAGVYELEAVNENGCLVTGIARVENLSLEGQFLELFEWSLDSICDNVICFGLESSVNFGDDSPFSILWEGPDETFNEWANNNNSFNSFCGVGPGLYRATITSECDTVRRSLFIEEPRECNSISGTLWVDQAADCALDPEDTRVPRYVVALTNQADGEMFYAMTDMAGNWTANVPLGVYVIEPTLDPFSPFGTCPPVNITLGGSPVTGIQLFLPAENACALLSTTATMPFLRRCFSSQAFVQYENRGSVTAIDAELVVVLDDFFTNVVPNRAFTSRNGNTFTFDLGDLDPFATGTIRFNFVVSCEASLGQSHCLEASIKPDEPCNPDENWNGALVQIDAIGCDGDSVRFHISNIGLDQMSVPLSYIIIEDGIMLSPDPYVNGLLLPQESMPISLPSNGATYQVVTNQEPNAPANDDPTAVVEGCNAAGEPVSTGFTNILPLNNGALTTTTVCRENVGAYDPNDKTGYPLGFGDNNGINPGTRLDYAIRFQNTGTDTAFTVVIRDTLPQELDLATLKLDAASHDFVATLDSNRVLTFVFENILLPDSTTNLAESQGVVQFSIDHDPTLSPGAIIRNEAAIYFDFNAPIITNKSRHVITKDGLPVSTRAELARQVALKVFPNPTEGVLNVRIPLADVGPNDALQVTDLYGRTLASTTYAQASAGWNLGHLPAGYYLVVVTDAAGRPRGRTGFVVAK